MQHWLILYVFYELYLYVLIFGEMKLNKFSHSQILQHIKYENDTLQIPKLEAIGMKTEVKAYTSKECFDLFLNKFKNALEDNKCTSTTIWQLVSAASLEGVVGPLVAMPDLHRGYELAIGCVLTLDANDPVVRIRSSMLGPDINCGMRVIKTSLAKNRLDTKGAVRRLANRLAKVITAGKKQDGLLSLNRSQTVAVLTKGLGAIDKRLTDEENSCFLTKQHILFERERTENGGCLSVSEESLPEETKRRLAKDGLFLGSLGAGNHFLEIDYVSEVFDQSFCEALGLVCGSVTLSVHTGSRGVGAAVAKQHEQMGAALLASKSAQRFLVEYRAACNFAWANRSVLSKKALEVLESLFGKTKAELVCDVSHNSMSFEDDRLVVRKGACKALPAGHCELEKRLEKFGMPVVVGGTMATGSFLVVNTGSSTNSCCHGAGRKLGRREAQMTLSKEETQMVLTEQGVELRSGQSALLEEAPSAYKDVEEVVEISERLGLIKKIARLRPIVVIKD